MIEENASEIEQVTIPNSPVYPHEFAIRKRKIHAKPIKAKEFEEFVLAAFEESAKQGIKTLTVEGLKSFPPFEASHRWTLTKKLRKLAARGIIFTARQPCSLPNDNCNIYYLRKEDLPLGYPAAPFSPVGRQHIFEALWENREKFISVQELKTLVCKRHPDQYSSDKYRTQLSRLLQKCEFYDYWYKHFEAPHSSLGELLSTVQCFATPSDPRDKIRIQYDCGMNTNGIIRYQIQMDKYWSEESKVLCKNLIMDLLGKSHVTPLSLYPLRSIFRV